MPGGLAKPGVKRAAPAGQQPAGKRARPTPARKCALARVNALCASLVTLSLLVVGCSLKCSSLSAAAVQLAPPSMLSSCICNDLTLCRLKKVRFCKRAGFARVLSRQVLAFTCLDQQTLCTYSSELLRELCG